MDICKQPLGSFWIGEDRRGLERIGEDQRGSERIREDRRGLKRIGEERRIFFYPFRSIE